jgi:zinc protease
MKKFKISKEKFNKILFAFLLFAFLVLNFSFALPAFGQMPAPGAPREAKIPIPVEQKLANNLRVIVIERKNVPLVTASLIIKAGGEVDPKNLSGATDLTAELLTKGTKTRTASQIAEEMEFLGGSINSNAAWDFSDVTWRVMSDKMDKATAIAADTVKNPIFAQEEIDRLRTQKLDELSVSLTRPNALANYVASAVVFGSAPYARPLGGTPESLKKIKREDLINIHSTYFKPNNSILIIAGDIEPAAAFALAQKHFGDWKNSDKPPVQADSEKTKALPAGIVSEKTKIAPTKITVIDLPNSGQAAVVAARRGIERKDTDFYKSLVANSVLGGGYSARLNQEIRIKRGLSYGAGSSLQARRFGGIFATRAQTKNESAAEVAAIVIDELNRLADEPITDAELTPRKAVLIGGFSRQLETTNGLVQAVGQLALYDLPLAEINSYIKNVQSVSDEQARDFVKALFATGVNLVIVGDAKVFQADLQKRFPSVSIETISVKELNLNSQTLRKN